MDSKRTRYIRRIFTLDRYHKGTGIYTWHIKDFEEYLHEQELHYGLHLISKKEEVSIKIEYTNMIWDYQIYFGSYKKRYHSLVEEDDRWLEIKKGLQQDLKAMGLEILSEQITDALKQKTYFEYQKQIDEQFKKYCIVEDTEK